MLKEEFIGSIEVEDYLNAYLNYEKNGLKEKIIMSSFLNDYLDKGLYAVEIIRDGKFYVRVENENDEIVSKEFSLGEEVVKKELTIEDFDLLENTDHTINFHVESIINDDELTAEDKIFMIRDFIKYLNKGLYRQDAEDKQGNMLQLILDQKTDKIIDIIYY